MADGIMKQKVKRYVEIRDKRVLKEHGVVHFEYIDYILIYR